MSANAAMVETQDTPFPKSSTATHPRSSLNGRQATDLILLSGGASVPPGAAGRFITTHDYVSSVRRSRFPEARRTATTICLTAGTTTIRIPT